MLERPGCQVTATPASREPAQQNSWGGGALSWPFISGSVVEFWPFISGSVVEFSPATREARVRFPASAAHLTFSTAFLSLPQTALCSGGSWS